MGMLTPLWLAHLQAAFYKYVDKNGNIHFTDRLESVPKEYRNQFKEYKEEENPKPTFPKKEGVTREQGRQLKESDEKRSAEAKELQEKSAREEKLKERQEIQNRIADVQGQIRAKQEEQRSLRTAWMVHDKIRLNQLNQEIAGLEQEIQSLQQKFAAEK